MFHKSKREFKKIEVKQNISFKCCLTLNFVLIFILFLKYHFLITSSLCSFISAEPL